nr:hypothetical protein [Pseudo-nitzschia hainanensis]
MFIGYIENRKQLGYSLRKDKECIAKMKMVYIPHFLKKQQVITIFFAMMLIFNVQSVEAKDNNNREIRLTAPIEKPGQETTQYLDDYKSTNQIKHDNLKKLLDFDENFRKSIELQNKINSRLKAEKKPTVTVIIRNGKTFFTSDNEYGESLRTHVLNLNTKMIPMPGGYEFYNPQSGLRIYLETQENLD